MNPVFSPGVLWRFAPRDEFLVLFLLGWVGGDWFCAPLFGAAYAREVGQLAIGEGEDEGAVFVLGVSGCGADVVFMGTLMLGRWHICS